MRIVCGVKPGNVLLYELSEYRVDLTNAGWNLGEGLTVIVPRAEKMANGLEYLKWHRRDSSYPFAIFNPRGPCFLAISPFK